MSPSTKVLIISSVAGVFSATLLAACVLYVFAWSVVGAFGSHFFDNPLVDIAALLIVLILGLISVSICPLTAVYLKTAVQAISPNTATRILIFGVIASLQIILFTLGTLSASAFMKFSHDVGRKRAEEEIEKRNRILNEMKSANIEIAAGTAKVVSRQNDADIAEATFRFTDVPGTVSYYYCFLSSQPNEKGLTFRMYDFPDGQSLARAIKARNDDGKWSFYKAHTDHLISDDPQSVTFQIEIKGLDPSTTFVTTTISPQLTLWAEESGFWNNHVFWRKPVPIQIQRPNEE